MSGDAVRVLHVEDDSVDALLTQEILHDEVGMNQFDVVHVDSLKSALRELGRKGYDAVLLDLNLKDISGIDNILAIKEENPEIPVVVLSGMDSYKSAIEAIDNGAQEYLVKGHCDGKVIRLALHSSIRRKSVERRLFKQANYDDLTGLPNRRLFQDYLERAITKAKRWDAHEIVMFVDLDNFKDINDNFGHDVGNAVLKEAAIRMTSTLRSSDIVARYGGDEFVVLLNDRSEDFQSSARQAATKLVYAFNAPFEYGSNVIQFSASIGITAYPLAGDDYSSVINSADKAMYRAKKNGGAQFQFADLPSAKIFAIS